MLWSASGISSLPGVDFQPNHLVPLIKFDESGGRRLVAVSNQAAKKSYGNQKKITDVLKCSDYKKECKLTIYF